MFGEWAALSGDFFLALFSNAINKKNRNLDPYAFAERFIQNSVKRAEALSNLYR